MIRTITRTLVVAAVAAAGLAGCSAADPAPVSNSLPVAGSAQAESSGPVAGSAPVAGCAGGLTGPVAPVEVAARLTDGRADPAPWRVDVPRNAPVVLRIEVDAPAEVHIHGYNEEAVAAPGAPACIELVADVPGVFEVEAHPGEPKPKALLVQLAVR